MNNGKLPIAIVGSGLAGLTAAQYLHQRGVPFVVFEAGNKIAGLASSFRDEEGFHHDFGAHFITNRLAAAIGVSGECRTVARYGESILLDGRVHSYPFGLMKLPRMTASGIASKLRAGVRTQEPDSAEDWFRNAYGKALTGEVVAPLIEAWSGVPISQLSAAVGSSLPGSVYRVLYLKLASRLLRRAVAIGYNREMRELASVHHVYPERGVSVLCERLVTGIEEAIRFETPVQNLVVEDGRAVAVVAKGERIEVSGIVNTAPANILAKITIGTDALEPFKRFRYRPMVFVNMRFKGRFLLPDTVLWLPERKFPFFRLTEAPISMPWLAPEGKTIITADIGCETTDDNWNMDDDSLIEECLKNIVQIVPDARQRFLGASVLRTKIAYPVFLTEYEEERQRFARSTGVEGLVSIGRNGEFAHIFMEDVYWRTREKMRHLVDTLHGS